MTWEVEYTDELEHWWRQDLSEGEQDEIAAVVGLLEPRSMVCRVRSSCRQAL
jgi:hypothetical protein